MKYVYRALIGTLALGVSWSALASPPALAIRDTEVITVNMTTVAPPRAPVTAENAVVEKVPMLGVALSHAKLDRERGKADPINYEARLSGVVSANSATNVTTGGNSIETGSFANMAGLPVVIQNTGANVLIQNSTIVNVQFR